MSRFGEVDIRVNVKDVLDNISVDEIIEFYGEGDLLDEIGMDACAAHFGLEEASPNLTEGEKE